MAFVQFTGVSLAFGARDILKDASLFLASGTKAALAGPNGAGKTTFMRIVAGLLAPDSGSRAVQKGTRVSYLPQSGVEYSGATVYEEAEKAYAALESLLREQESIGSALERATSDDPRTQALLEDYHHIMETLEDSGYTRRRDRIEEVLGGLGFEMDELDRPIGEFSGGWQMRVALAKVVLENPDIMLLDEPTNYLDIEARTWLEDFLVSFKGGFVVVSHDRSFLDTTVREVYEVWNGRLGRYPGTYSSYENQRKTELEGLFAAWERQQEEIGKLEDFIRRFRYNESKAALVQSRVKQLGKIEPIVVPEGMKRVHFSFPAPPHCGRIALSMEGLRKSYGDKRVVDELSLTIDSGLKLAFVGRNGAGKSTLMRLIAGAEKPSEGEIRLGTGIAVGYFSQDVADALDDSRTVEEEAEAMCPTALVPGLRNLLGAFLFRGDDIHKPVRVLSGGERSRLALLRLLLKPSNLLVFDEPTNHLDLDSKDVLLDALKRFPGTVLFVSHDRFFIEGLAERVLELRCGASPRFYHGDYAYYLEKKERERLDGTGSATVSAAPHPSAPFTASGPARLDPAELAVPGPAPGSAEAREQEKQRKAARNRLRKREEELCEAIERTATERQSILDMMNLSENYSDGARMRELRKKADGLEALEASLSSEWETVAHELEMDR